MNVLITGSAGFIGKNITEWFADRYNVCGMDKLDGKDIRDIDECMKWTRNRHVVIHLAALPGVRESFNDPMETFRTNVLGTAMLIEASIANGVDKFIFASSGAADNRDDSPYAMSKWMAEYNIQLAPIDSVILRFSNVYGPYSEHKTSLIANAMKALRNGNNIDVYGDGSNARDFIHVYDVCRAVELAMLSTEKHNCPIEIGTGKAIAVMDVISELVLVSEKNLNVNHTPKVLEQQRVAANPERAYRELGFKTSIPLRTGLKQTLEAWR